MRYTNIALIFFILLLFTTFVYSDEDFARIECYRHGAGDDNAHWILWFDAGSEKPIGPNSHLFLRVRRPSISPEDVMYNIVIRNNITGAEWYQIDGWVAMTSTDWFIWSPRFLGVDDTPSGTPVNTPFIQNCISDSDDGSSATGYIYYDISEVRIGETWETGTPILLRDSSAFGTVANRWYHAAFTQVNWIPRFAYYNSESPGYTTIGTKQKNTPGDNTQYWCYNFVPALPGRDGDMTNYSLYLRYRKSPLSEEDCCLHERGLDVTGFDFGFTDGWWWDTWNYLTTTDWITHEFPCPSTAGIVRFAIGVSDWDDADSSTALLLVDIDRVVWAPQGYGENIDGAAADPKATELQHRDYYPNTTPQELSDFSVIWCTHALNYGYAQWISVPTKAEVWSLY